MDRNCNILSLFARSDLPEIKLNLYVECVLYLQLVTSSGGQEVSILLFLAGAVICGPDSLLTGSVPMTVR